MSTGRNQLFAPDFNVPNRGVDVKRLRREIRTTITEAEKEYGQRDERYSICQVFFHRPRSQKHRDGSISAEAPGSKRLIISLGSACVTNEAERAYLLAHECVHVLSYVPTHQISWLEEGVCEDFALRYVRRRFRQPVVSTAHPRYAEAHACVRRLLELCPDAIRTARATECSLSKVSAELLTQVCPSCPTGLFRAVVQKFSA